MLTIRLPTPRPKRKSIVALRSAKGFPDDPERGERELQTQASPALDHLRSSS